MEKFLWIHLNLRRKVILGFAIWLCALGAISVVSYYNLLRIEGKVAVVEIADDLSNIILEMRRYEKNYFLYGEGYDENVIHGRMALDKLDEAENYGRQLLVADSIAHIREALTAYQQNLDRIHRAGYAVSKKDIDRLRSLGQQLEETSRRMVRFERKRIMQINEQLRRNLFISLAMVLVLGAGLVHFLRNRIIRPLREVEETTLKIAEGSFEPVTMGRADDEIRRIMQAINRMVSELERRQEQLVQNKKLSSIGTLSSGIAHQLNNPLNNISTSCQLLMEEGQAPDPEFTARMLQNIERETLRARDIVRGLLEFSRSHEFALRRENLREVVRGAIRLISSQTPPGVEIESWIPEDIEVDMDRQQIQEMLLNLLINGIHAVAGVGTGLSVTAEADPGRNRVSLFVEDDGCGFSEEVRGQMFDPFFTTKDVGSGTGLGLYIAYGVVRKHGGEICVEGREGVGARFVIRLPMRLAELPKEQG